MAFGPMRHPSIKDLGIYPSEPTVEVKFNRGDLSGSRVETVTYVFERPGEVEIPSIESYWWDIRATTLKRIELPGLSLRIVGGPTGESVATGNATRQLHTQLLWPALLAAALAAVIAFRFGGVISEIITAWRKSRSESEAMYFRQVMRSARSGDQKAVLRHTMRWLDRINNDSRPARLDQFLRQFGDTRTQADALELMETLSPDRAKSDITALASGLAAARTRWRQAQCVRRQVTGSLPGLNSEI